jgi:hypothetical protein
MTAYGRALIVGLFFVVTHCYALGDLMLTVEQRVKLDILRSSGAMPSKSPVSSEVKLNGFYFKNKDGLHKGQFWIDGKTLDETKADNDVVLKRFNESSQVVDLAIKKKGVELPFKAGQKLKLDKGELVDAYQQ